MDSLNISAQSCINLYPEIYKQGNAKVVTALRNTAGLDLFATMSSGSNKCRGAYESSTGRIFIARGNGVSEFSTAGVETFRFALTTGVTPSTSTIVRFADNGTKMLVTDGTDGIEFDLDTNVATTITDTAYPSGAFIGLMDGFYLGNVPDTTLVRYSSVDDPTTWNTLSDFSKEGSSDPVTAFIVHDRRVWAFGAQSYEVFYNTGNSDNQFLRFEGTYSDIGIAAPDSLATDGNSLFWLGSSQAGFGQIYMSQGFNGVPISTVPIERAIHTYTITNDAEGFCYQQDGHNFYVLTFPSEDKTWVYDTTTGMWHERSFRNTSNARAERIRPRVHVYFNGKNYLGDYENGNIYSYEQDVYTDDGDPIVRERTSPHIWQALERIYYASFQLDVETGVGLPTGQGDDPKIMLSWSNDGGNTYSNEYQLSSGKIGEYKTRVKKNRLGQSRDRVFKVTYSDPTSFNILSAHIEVG